MVEPEFFQGSIERPAERIRRQIFVPDFCGDMQVFAGNARGCNRGTHGSSLSYISAVSRCR